MKFFLLMGGFVGFSAVFVASVYAGNNMAIALRDATVGCMVGGMLFRMLHSAYIAGLKGCIADRARMAKSAEIDDDGDSARRRRV